jgi:nucleoside-diphosphate-sugar epimerase
MRIFLTGATGYIGRPVLDALVRGGHHVTALVRDAQRANRIKSWGALPVVGNLAEPESYRAAAEGHDGYIHAAYDSTSNNGPAIDRAAIDVIMAAAKATPPAASGASGKRFIIYTSGVWVLGPAPEPVTEDAPVNPVSLVAWRPPHEQLVLRETGPHLRTMVIRPGIVYGGDHGIVVDLFKSASNGMVRVIGDGTNRWPLVYDRDLADLYARLANSEHADGVYHATDDGEERINDIVSALLPYLPVRPDVRHVPLEEARTKMGAFADALALDQVVRSPRARSLGWTPTLQSVSGNAARLLEEWRSSRT